jgi:hypothetical protein
VASTGGTTPGLHQILPREQAGARSGERFEFQYHQAAADALQVLDDAEVTCVYCEWHDDYVIESAGASNYRFHQVKTRSLSEGPWTLNEFFGIQRAKGKKGPNNLPRKSIASPDSIFGRLFDHMSKFGDRCEWFVFVSNAATSSEFANLLSDVRATANHGVLSGESKSEFTRLCAPLVATFPSLSDEAFFHFLKRLSIREALGKLTDLQPTRLLIGGRIYEMSEVNLTMSEAQRIASDLVAAVRAKSHRTLKAPPATTSELRTAKGLVLEDVLRLLSLSTTGYKALKAGGKESVITLSRLHRLCKRSGVSDALIPELCCLKTTWEAWWITQRHIVNVLDQIALKGECAEALHIHAAGKLDFNGLRWQARALALKYAPILTSTEPINEQHVFGLMMALAVEAES